MNKYRSRICYNADKGSGGGAPAPAPAADDSFVFGDDKALHTLNYDFFGGTDGGEENVSDSDNADSVPGSADSQGEKPAGEEEEADGGVPAKPAVPTEPNATAELLAAKDKIIGLMAEKTAKPTGEEEKKEVKDTTPPYLFRIPPELIAGIRSEEPAEAEHAIASLLSGLAKEVHKTVTAQFTQALQLQQQTLPQQVQQMLQVQQVVQETRADFYGRYPQLDKPALYGIISQIGDKYMQNGYTKEIGDKIAKEVYETLGVPMPKAGAAPEPKKQKQTPPKMMSSSTRPGGGMGQSSGDTLEEQFLELASIL